MAEFYDESKFKLLKDWNWSKVIGKADDLQYQENEEKMYELLLEYLGIEDETELTSEHLQNLQDLIAYLETPYADGGLGHDQMAPQHTIIRSTQSHFDGLNLEE